MNNSKLSEIDIKAARFLGKKYVKVPYAIVNWIWSPSPHVRRVGQVYFLLFVCSNYADGMSAIGGNASSCGIGEVLMKYDDLAASADLTPSTARRCVYELRDAGLLDVSRMGDASCFHLNGYELFMQGTETRFFPDSPWKKKPLSGMPDEEPGIIGMNKPRIDLLDL